AWGLAEPWGGFLGRSLSRLSYWSHPSRRDAAWTRTRVAARLLFRLLHGFARNHVLIVLDPRQQQLDAGAARSHHHRRQDHSRGLVSDYNWTNHAGALAAHAARRLPDHGNVRGGQRCLVRAARNPSYRGARHAALGVGARGGADPNSTLFRSFDRSLCARTSACKVCGNRGALEDATACERGADCNPR